MADTAATLDSEETAVPVTTKPKAKAQAKFEPEDNFLSEAIAPARKHLTYQDGFRLGVGMAIGLLFVGVILGGLTLGAIFALRMMH